MSYRPRNFNNYERMNSGRIPSSAPYPPSNPRYPPRGGGQNPQKPIFSPYSVPNPSYVPNHMIPNYPNPRFDNFSSDDVISNFENPRVGTNSIVPNFQKSQFGPSKMKSEPILSSRPPILQKLVQQLKSRVLNFMISNVRNNVTIDSLYAFCNHDDCTVLRIIISNILEEEKIVIVMIEFKSVEDAEKILDFADGRELFSDSCLIKAKFASVRALTVSQNNESMWDYKVSGFDMPQITETFRNNLPSEAQSYAPQKSVNPTNKYWQFGGLSTSQGDLPTEMQPYAPILVNPVNSCERGGPSTAVDFGRTVELSEVKFTKLTCDRVFNLFCQYAKVECIKVVNQGSMAYIKMQTMEDANTVIDKLDKPLGINRSREQLVRANPVSYNFCEVQMNDPTFKSYIGSPLNREPLEITYVPHKILYFTDAPQSLTAQKVKEMITQNAPSIKNVEIWLLPPEQNSTMISGYLRFHTFEDAGLALVECNNIILTCNNTGQQFPWKLSFSFPDKIPATNEPGIRHDAILNGMKSMEDKRRETNLHKNVKKLRKAEIRKFRKQNKLIVDREERMLKNKEMKEQVGKNITVEKLAKGQVSFLSD